MMHGRRGVDRRFKHSGDDVDLTPPVDVGDGSEDGDAGGVLEVHIGVTL